MAESIWAGLPGQEHLKRGCGGPQTNKKHSSVLCEAPRTDPQLLLARVVSLTPRGQRSWSSDLFTITVYKLHSIVCILCAFSSHLI